MMRKLLLFFAMLCVSVGMQAAITITPANNIYVGGTAYNGYGIYGAKAGEIAQLLNGTYEGTVNWNGVTLDQLKSAVLIKVGSTSEPNVLNTDDLEALELLNGAKFLDIDGSVLDLGANISKIKAGPAIEAVSLPNCLTKAQVNAAGAALAACNANFGSCLSLDTEMEPKDITTYTYTAPCTSEEVEYTGTVTDGKGYIEINRPLTLTSSSFSYTNTKYKNEVIACSESDIDAEGYIVPNSLKVELTKTDNPTSSYSYNGIDLSGFTWGINNDGVTTQDIWGWGGTPNPLPSGTQVDVVVTHNYTYTYTWRNNYNQPEATLTYEGEPLGNETDGYYAMIENSYSDQAGYRFEVSKEYNYTYTDLDCNEATTSYTDGPHETINLSNNYEVNLTATTQTINVPVEGGDCDAIAYVNTPGTLYQAVSLDVNDAASVTGLVVSGNINNGDISVHYGATDPNGNKNDSDKFDDNGAIPAFYINNSAAPIKSVDMSDAVIDDYRHLRVLNAYAASLESVVFPKTVTKIPNYCCYSQGNNGNQNLSNIVFPTEAATLTIGDYAFHHVAITSLLVPSSVTRIGDYAFATCPNLYDVEMEALKGECGFGNNVFELCPALQHVTLSEGVTSIGDYQFNQCGLLESIRIPSTCTTIGSYAFQFCYSIHEITIPEGVELIKLNAFEGAGLTDIYLMATSIATLPKIFAMSPTGAGPSSFSYQRTTGNNTIPAEHRSDLSGADYDEVMTWYQEEQSGSEGLGSGNCLTALHYPESLKPFFEAIDVTEFYSPAELASIPLQTMQSGIQHYYTPDEYLDMVTDAQYKEILQAIVDNKMRSGYGSGDAFNFGDEDYQFLPQSYAVDPQKDGSGTTPFGPDKDDRYYPSQTSYVLRMAAGATSTQAGGVGGEEVASAWGWRQFPLASSVESIGEIPYEKLYDDTWYTMCFPWKMEDNQLFSAFNQKCEIVEFKGAEMVKQDDENYNLVFHFDDVAATYYMDADGIEYNREPDGERKDGAGHNLYVYTPVNGGSSVSAPNPLPDKNTTDPAVKEQYGKYLSIKNIMVLPGHPYMIHPSIGAAPGRPAKVYINGVKKVTVGGDNDEYATYEELAEAAKVNKKVAEISKTGEAVAEEWKTPSGVPGGSYTFIGNINDEVIPEGATEGDGGKKDMPLPCYFLGVKNGSYWPMYYRRTTGGQKKWSQYTAIIVPDEAAQANIEAFMSTGSSSSAGAKEIVFGDWEIVDEDQMATVIDNAVAEGKDKNEPAKIQHLNVVYNIKGQVVRSNSSSVEGLPKGLYIVNGKKYMVK